MKPATVLFLLYLHLVQKWHRNIWAKQTHRWSKPLQGKCVLKSVLQLAKGALARDGWLERNRWEINSSPTTEKLRQHTPNYRHNKTIRLTHNDSTISGLWIFFGESTTGRYKPWRLRASDNLLQNNTGTGTNKPDYPDIWFNARTLLSTVNKAL